MKIINTQDFFCQNDGWYKFNFYLQSCHESLNSQLYQIFLEYKQSIENFRESNKEFNMMFKNLKTHQKHI